MIRLWFNYSLSKGIRFLDYWNLGEIKAHVLVIGPLAFSISWNTKGAISKQLAKVR
jgi:hypothetical protein